MKTHHSFDIVVIGAGIAGASAAAELAQFNSVGLLEMENHPGYHATGRSAAIFAQNYGPRQVRAITRASEPFFTKNDRAFSDTPLFSPRPIIRIASRDQLPALKSLYKDMSVDCPLRWLDQAELQELVPLLQKDKIVAGFMNETSQDIDVNGLHRGYLRRFQSRGGTLICNAPASRIAGTAQGWEITVGHNRIDAKVIVNAAGAWADEIAVMAGISPLGLTPLRRCAITFDAPPGYNTKALPMMVDVDDQFYLKPEAGRLLASPSDEVLSAPCDSRPEELDIAICVDRISKVFDVDVKRIESSWAGLRTFAPDGLPVCGFDLTAPDFFWLAGQGGYGVQTAPALAQITAALVSKKPMPPTITQAGIDLRELSPRRLFTAA